MRHRVGGLPPGGAPNPRGTRVLGIRPLGEYPQLEPTNCDEEARKVCADLVFGVGSSKQSEK